MPHENRSLIVSSQRTQQVHPPITRCGLKILSIHPIHSLIQKGAGAWAAGGGSLLPLSYRSVCVIVGYRPAVPVQYYDNSR